MVRFEPGTFHSASERLNHLAIPETVWMYTEYRCHDQCCVNQCSTKWCKNWFHGKNKDYWKISLDFTEVYPDAELTLWTISTLDVYTLDIYILPLDIYTNIPTLELSVPPPGRQQHQISCQFLPPGSSTKSASSFTHMQQHQISFQFLPPSSSTKSASSFHHQTAAPNQLPVSTTRQQHHISQPQARHSASQLLTLPPCHTHIMAARSVVV